MLRGALFGTVAMAVALAALTNAKAADAPAERKATEIEELIVTAEKREQNLQKVPVAISAYTAEQREVRGIATIQDFTNFTPGLQYDSNRDRASIRGVGRLTNRLSAEAAVATYSDGLYTTSVAEAGKSTLFVERVEVLRGPQGTLYGRNSIAGAINVISKRPTKALYGEARATIGTYGFQNYEAVISGPVSDSLRLRLAGTQTLQSGWSTNLARDEKAPKTDIWGLEFQLEKDFERAQLWLKLATYEWDNRAGGNTFNTRQFDTARTSPNSGLFFNPSYGFNTIDPINGQPVRSTQLGNVRTNPQLTDVRTTSSDGPNVVKNDEILIANVHFTYDFDGFSAKYVGGYNSYHFRSLTDSDGVDMLSYTIPLNPSPLPAQNTCQYVPGCQALTVFPRISFLYDEANHWNSQEINIYSTKPGPLQWIVGAYYFDEGYHNPEEFAAPFQPGVLTPTGGVANPAGNAPNPTGSTYFFDYKMRTRSVATFAQIDWNFAPDWTFTAGIRETRDFKSGFEDFRSTCFTAACIGDPRVFGTLVGARALDITTTLAATYPTAAEAAQPGVSTPARQVGPNAFVNYNINPATGRAHRRLRDDWNAVTGTLGLQWEVDADTNTYLKYGRGYKSGGFNAGEITYSPGTRPEFVDAFEFGLKTRLGRKFTINTAAYWYDYKDLQIPIQVFNGFITTSQFFNVPKSVSKGVEVEAYWSPIERSLITLSYSYTDAHITSGCSAAAGNCVQDPNDPNGQEARAINVVRLPTGAALQSLKGNKLPVNPEHKLALSGTYTWVIGDSTLSLTGSWFWRDETYATIFTREYNRAPSWDQTNFNARWQSPDRRLTLVAYMRNTFDQLTFPASGGGTRLSPDPATPTLLNSNVTKSLFLNPPRAYGVGAYYKFW